VHVKPNDAAAASLPKFAVRAVPAVFLSWHMQPGHKWDGQVCVAPLSQFENESLAAGSFTKAPRTWLTQEVFLPKGDVFFPLKARYDQARLSLPPLLVPSASVSLDSLRGMRTADLGPLVSPEVEPVGSSPDEDDGCLMS